MITQVGRMAIGALLAMAVTGCASMDQPAERVEPIRGSAPEAITTDYTAALRCIGRHVKSQPYPAPRLAVGLITDMTGAQDQLQGRRLTQGATLMAITAAADAGMRLVERYDMGVLQVELDYARSGLLRDSEQVIREVQAGSIQGADLYIIGGITEFNPNIRSRGADAFASGQSARAASLSLGGSDYVVDVGIDLRLIDARSSEVLAVRSLRKQIVGREIRAGVFGFVDGTTIDIGGGQRAMEPVQTAVRTMVDRIVYEFIASLYDVPPEFCQQAVSEEVRVADTSAVRGADTAIMPAIGTPDAAPATLSAASEPMQPAAPRPDSSQPVLRTLEAQVSDGSAVLIQASATRPLASLPVPETAPSATAEPGLTGAAALQKLRGRR
ncbi:MAG: CsgG/HfaB family protein [Hyphomonas sp.]